MIQELQGHVRPRPIRVAFLVGDGEHADLALDGIFADSYKRWGGRFSLIVPIYDDKISDEYWDWLEAYDPDIVYSYTPLSSELILSIHERIGPSEIKVHNHRGKPRLDVHGFTPDYKFEPLQSLATLFHHRRFVKVKNGDTLGVIDSWHTEKPTRFLTDNFGTYHYSYGTSIWPNDARAAATLKTIVDPEYVSNCKFRVPLDLDMLDSELDAFEEFTYRRVSSLSMSSVRFAPKLNIRSQRWSTAFNLVVGNSLEDRIIFWNARSLIPDWLDNDLNCLRVEHEQFDDEKFLAVLGEFLKRNNHVNAGSGGQSQLIIRSASLTEKELSSVQEKIESTKPWSFVRSEKVSSLDELVPTKDELTHAREGHRRGAGFNTGPNTERFSWMPPTLKPPIAPPHILEDAPPRQRFVQGCWATDCELKLHGAEFNERNRWHLPKRWRMARIPQFNRADSTFNQIFPVPRSNRLGQLTFYTNVDSVVESILLPSGADAIYCALTRDGLHTEDDVSVGRVLPKPKVKFAEPSNEARYFNGVLGLFGGLDEAAQYLLHPFLRKMFEDLGGAQELTTEKVEVMSNTLSKRANGGQDFSLSVKEDRETLANLIVKAAKGLKAPIEMLSFDTLKENWDSYREAFWERTGKPDQDPNDDYDYEESDRRTLENCLIALRQSEILFQGQRFVCKNCHHRNWISLDEFQIKLSCSVCKTSLSAPIAGQWFFRANEFLIHCLRDRSVLSLVWVLHTIQRRSRSSFYYAGPTKFFYEYDNVDANRPDSEADLLVVADGKTILCEVKSSWSILRKKDIGALVKQAKIIRPDTIMLAIMDEGTKLKVEIENARNELEKEGIELEVLTWRQDGWFDRPRLPSGR